ncbi:hypothetical protein [Vibrio cholerae]|uniref:hypothetical protein n=1 Tax=Vibrio cholerae TaxID=666 RepID=UPI003080E0A8
MKINDCKKEIKSLSIQEKELVSGGVETSTILGYAGLAFTAAAFGWTYGNAYYGQGGAGDRRPR